MRQTYPAISRIQAFRFRLIYRKDRSTPNKNNSCTYPGISQAAASYMGKDMRQILQRFRKVLVLILLCCPYAPAQSGNVLSCDTQTAFVADRPGQTTPPVLVAKGVLQVESGVWAEQSRSDGQSQTSWLYPTTLVRIGIQQNFELRIQCDIAGVPAQENRTSSYVTGVSGISIGSKFPMIEENGFIPKTAFLASVKLPSIGNPSLRPSYLAPSIGLCFQNTFNDNWSLGYEANSSWDGENAASQQLLSASLNYAISSRIGSFVEYYLTTGETTDPAHAVDFGISYLLLKNLQIDITGGFGLNVKSFDSGFGIGIAWQI